MLKYSSRMFFEKNWNKKIKSKFAKKQIEHLIELFRILKNNLFATQTQQIMYKNEHTKFMSYKIENYVNLNDKNIKIKRNKKLKWKFFESFKIFEYIENQIYRLNLFKRWRIHNVFHVFFWKNLMLTKKKARKRHNFLNLFIELKILNWTKTWKWKSRKNSMKSKQLKTTKFSKSMKFQTSFSTNSISTIW